MAQGDWQAHAPTLGVFLNGNEIPDRTPDGDHISDDSFLVLLNAGAEPATFRLPLARFGRTGVELSTFDPDAEPVSYRHRQDVVLEPRSLLLLRRA